MSKYAALHAALNQLDAAEKHAEASRRAVDEHVALHFGVTPKVDLSKAPQEQGEAASRKAESVQARVVALPVAVAPGMDLVKAVRDQGFNLSGADEAQLREVSDVLASLAGKSEGEVVAALSGSGVVVH